MKNIDQIILVLSIITSFALGIYIGATVAENETKRRALELADDVECYSNRDIEHILYNTEADNLSINFREKE